MSREDLIDDWQQRWVEIVRPLEGGENSVERWKRRSQVRMYRCLTSMYSDGCWRTAARLDELPRSTNLTDIELHPQAKPKSVAQLRKALKKVHSRLSISVTPGPYASGLRPGDWICVTSANGQRSLKHQSRLMAHYSIPFRIRYSSNAKSLYVNLRDYHLALRLISGLREWLSEHAPPRRRASGIVRAARGLGHAIRFAIDAFRGITT